MKFIAVVSDEAPPGRADNGHGERADDPPVAGAARGSFQTAAERVRGYVPPAVHNGDGGGDGGGGGRAHMPSLWSDLAAQDVMTDHPVCVERSTSIRDLARALELNHISSVPVVDQTGSYIGTVSREDLITACLDGKAEIPPAYVFQVLAAPGGEDPEMVESLACVEDFMTEPTVTVSPGAPLGEIARRMSRAHLHKIVVVDEAGAPVGVITSYRLLGLWPE